MLHAAPTGDLIDHLDARIPGWMDRYSVPGLAIAVVERGRPVFMKAYGLADESGRPFTVDTPGRMESISKSVTAWGVMTLVDKGLVDLDRPVQQYLRSFTLPESPYREEAITVRQLLSQTSGMPLGQIGVIYTPGDDMPSLRSSLKANAIAVRNPGEAFFYSNVNYHLLELLIEEVTGEDFAQYMERAVLRPAGMKQATFTYSEDFKVPVAKGYRIDGTEVPVYVYPEKGAGGLFATLPDIVAFLRTESGLNPAARLSADSRSQMLSPQTDVGGVYGAVFPHYGFGHFMETLHSGQRAVSHGGQGTGWMTHFHLIPERGDGIVIITNSQRSWPLFAAILTEWGKAYGAGPVGMTSILYLQKAVWIVVGLIVLLAPYLAYRLRFRRPSRWGSVVEGAVGLLILAVLVYASRLDYVVLQSILPRLYSYLTASLAFLAFTLLVRALAGWLAARGRPAGQVSAS